MGKRILILGSEGYLGRALRRHLEEKGGYEILGVDNGARERNVNEVGSESLIPREDLSDTINFDILDHKKLKEVIEDFKPDTIVHFAEQPSAPYSMMDAEHAAYTQHNNIVGTLNLLWAIKETNPSIHLIKLGTEGEYPDWLWGDGKLVPAGPRIKVDFGDRKNWEIPTPHYAGSWYHWTKVHDSNNIDYACRIWGLKATDLNQGVVYGHRYDTRLDYDEYFGTIVHRFVTQAVAGIPLTVFGKGDQVRGFINLQNSLEAVELVANHPPKEGGFRVIHQTTKEYSVNEVANMVQELTGCEIDHIKSPRLEREECEFNFDKHDLLEMGLKPILLDRELPNLLEIAEKYKDRIKKDVIHPKTTWK